MSRSAARKSARKTVRRGARNAGVAKRRSSRSQAKRRYAPRMPPERAGMKHDEGELRKTSTVVSIGRATGAARGRPLSLSAPLPFVAAKLARPQMLRALVRRPRLIEQFDAAIRRPVTVINAGAGWGKTVLASSWAETRPARSSGCGSGGRGPRPRGTRSVARRRGRPCAGGSGPSGRLRAGPCARRASAAWR